MGCLCVIPEYQSKGIGTQAFKHTQSVYSDWRKITLITPADKEENIKFYTQKCGFSVASKSMDGNIEVINLYIER
ncbi:GNAT family N-acetyltransferase [Pseudoruminococcus massiliensis]|uniref:GNAT family N-acetyltransferase n=2 Tax=Pseudoruminococcus massiliensis TaxID=2086583 RepID=UPI003AF165EB